MRRAAQDAPADVAGELAAKGALCAALAGRLAERDCQLAAVERRVCRLESAAHALPRPLQAAFSLPGEAPSLAPQPNLAPTGTSPAVVGQRLEPSDAGGAEPAGAHEDGAATPGQEPDQAASTPEPGTPGGRAKTPHGAGGGEHGGVPSAANGAPETEPQGLLRAGSQGSPAGFAAEAGAFLTPLPAGGERPPAAPRLLSSTSPQREAHGLPRLPRTRSSSAALAAWRRSPSPGAAAAAQDAAGAGRPHNDRGLLGRRPIGAGAAMRWRAASDAQARSPLIHVFLGFFWGSVVRYQVSVVGCFC